MLSRKCHILTIIAVMIRYSFSVITSKSNIFLTIFEFNTVNKMSIDCVCFLGYHLQLPPLTSPAIQQPNYKPNHKQRHKAINKHISRIDNQGEEDDTFNI